MSTRRNTDPDCYIPLENVDEPIEFYTQQNNTMKKGDRVLINSSRSNTNMYSGLEGVISSVDSIDNRTMFPYYVEVDEAGAWFKETEVTLIPETPKDNAPGFITACAIAVMLFYGTLAACNAPDKTPTKPDTLQYLSPGQIPSDNLKDTVGGSING